MYKNIMVPIDLSDSDGGEGVMRQAKQIAECYSAQLTLVSVVEPIPPIVAFQMPKEYGQKARDTVKQELAKLAQKVGLAEGSYTTASRHGHVYHEILDVAQELKPDLILIGSHDPEASDYLLGSVAARIVRHAGCSVFVIRPTAGV